MSTSGPRSMAVGHRADSQGVVKISNKVASSRPPVIVTDRNNPDRRYSKGRFLGKGGFAKCYELTDVQTNRTWAGKIVEKKTLIKYRAKEKLTSEIKIHKSLNHESVVGFHRFFEDQDCVYILLEVCDSQTMMELHKRRRILTEPETRYYMKQIVEATKYMHDNNIIHRDLKLGNLFLDHDLRIKVGDFGLATRIKHDGERKKTLCGTPNYIAPEILNRTDGHSFPVDIWSIGCIMYTLLCGRPPFETSNIESTYRRIRSNEYRFPTSIAVSSHAMSLIRWMLSAKPEDRPSLTDIMQHPFMQGFTPDTLPLSSLARAPHFTKEQLGQDAVSAVPARRKPLGTVNTNSPAPTGSTVAKKATTSAAGPAVVSADLAPVDGVHAEVQPSRRRVGGGSSGGGARSESRAGLQAMHSLLRKVLSLQASATPSEVFPRTAPAKLSSSSVWISKWVDYSNKYGLGYQLSDGSVGVLFNDSTKMILSQDQQRIEFIDRDAQGAEKTLLTLSDYPTDLHKKVTLLKYFKNYMTEHLLNGGNQAGEEDAAAAIRELVHMKKWSRTSNAIVFRLSSNTVQINFFNHTKLIVDTSLGIVTFIDKNRDINSYYLEDIGKTNSTDANIKDMIGRLKYCSQIVENMIRPSDQA